MSSYQSLILEGGFILAKKTFESYVVHRLTPSTISLFLFLFIVSLAIAPGAGVQLSEFSYSDIPEDSILSQRQFGIPFLSPAIILFFPLLFFFIVQQISSKSRIKFSTFELLFFCFLIVAEISAVAAFDIQASLVWLMKIIFGLAIYTVFSRLRLNMEQVRVILYAFLATILFNVILAIFQVISGRLVGLPFENIRTIISPQKLSSFQGTDYFRAVGLFSQPKQLSSYLALLLPISVALTFFSRGKIRIFAYFAAAGCLMVSILALARWTLITNLFSLVLAFILLKHYGFLSQVSRKLKIYILTLFSLIVFVFLLSGRQTIFDRFSYFSFEDKSLLARLELIEQSLEVVRQNPILGIGPGNFSGYLINYDFTESNVSRRFPAPVHSFYLLTASEVGMVSLFIILVAMVAAVKFFLDRVRSLQVDNKLIAIGLFLAFVTFFFNGLWDLRSFENRIGFLFWLLLGLLMNILNRRHIRERSLQ